MRRILPLFLLLAMLSTSCSKEALVQPTSESISVVGGAKSATVTTPSNTDLGQTGTPQDISGSNIPKPGVSDSTSTSGDISDDGEDLSDSEKSRKKRR